ncbi:hemerythrin domain-containing protein [Lysobacter sp. A03]|uniref:hemerythrin domain-containing protein n=1 Tax=Lysobacter sp. A03 TaxID=1199154 RepID=UPI0005B708FF|nr:hemerythrin domain-containing protein [Lysobacter sp. A03]KIQ97535.1 Regulator of cell morphogenesis and NO signaling [Lysobacter sp. A03]
MADDILKTLKEEHDHLRDLFKKMEDTTERAEKGRTELLEKIKQGLIPHAVWEEEVFYPEFKKRADRDGRKTHAEAVAEHRAVELRVLPDLEAASPTTTEFAGRAKVLGEFVDHHATEEEDTMFKMARSLFSTEERAQLDAQYKEWKGTPAAAKAVEKALRKGAEANKTNPPPAS